MSLADSELTILDAHNLSIELSDLGNKPDYSEDRRNALKEALLFLKDRTDYQIFGVCADSLDEGIGALHEYARAFDCAIDAIDTVGSSQTGSVYIKFNPRRSLFHVAPYSGEYKGVLISYQSDYEDGHNGTYGHFPLNLFAKSQ